MAIEGHEFTPKDVEQDEDKAEMVFQRDRCCFCIPRLGPIRSASTEEGPWDRGVNALMKVREWTEIAAGPRWKTFIRRFNRSKTGGGVRHGKFQYDPLSYALNFDEGDGQHGDLDEDEYMIKGSFSLRYAAVPVSANSSMDLGKDAPPLT
ncbi:hypothetical protein Vadar_008735 [Vaccinium darrowii]|uniref:Uncharacterized protein n=1 Tax=Vaccinium darrowii TaxID=229202 RepID=A0ACB7ZJ26_9ERIC|nr:hypothetical protein Vadar_008735 [Vaccinium darrowii]